MKLLTTRAIFTCAHPPGQADAGPHAQGFVRIGGDPVLVGNDPGGLGVGMCPLVPPNNRPCTTTRRPVAGHSRWIRIDGTPVCLDRITGPTNGVPPGRYAVVRPGQELVREVEP
jgi:hypothetical protein